MKVIDVNLVLALYKWNVYGVVGGIAIVRETS